MLRSVWRWQPRRCFRASPLRGHLQSSRHRSNPNDSQLRLALIGVYFGCIGGSYVAAEYGSRNESRMAKPSQSSYKYLICGAGVAAQEALKVFLEHDVGDDVLLVSPEWAECRRWLDDRGHSKRVTEDEETGVLSHVINVFQEALSYPLSFIAQKRSPEIVIGPKVDQVDVSSRIAVLNDGTEIAFERCLIAVGSAMPDIPTGKIVSREAEGLVSGAQSQADWRAIDTVIESGEKFSFGSNDARAHLTVVGGGWMSMAAGAAIVERGADVTFSHSEPAFLARYFPKYLGQELLSRFLWQSDGGVDTLSYAALRYVLARKPMEQSMRPFEAEVHVGTVFDAFSIVDFRTDHIVFAPTLPSRIPIDIPAAMQNSGLVVNPELAVASDVYAAGASISVGSGAVAYPEVMRWSADHARSTGRHAALNILGAREPYTHRPTLTVDLDSICLRVHIFGDVDGSAETFGYFQRGKERDENSAGGQLELGALFCVKPAPLSHRGAAQRLTITGIAIWEGSRTTTLNDVKGTRLRAAKLLEEAPVTRPELELLMDNFAREELGLSVFADGPRPEQTLSVSVPADDEKSTCAEEKEEVLKPLADIRKPSRRVIWRRHRSARTIRVRPEELLWVKDEWIGAVSPESSSDRVSQAYTDLLKGAAPHHQD